MQQFAGRLYGPLIARGHRLVARLRRQLLGPQRDHPRPRLRRYAGLPELRGRKPFGGHILSHDFIEAALMRRAGWAIHMVPDARRQLRGSARRR